MNGRNSCPEALQIWLPSEQAFLERAFRVKNESYLHFFKFQFILSHYFTILFATSIQMQIHKLNWNLKKNCAQP